ncbi:MAG: 30S ribosome-binding factor RbfA [Nitrospirae bacterium]|nr:30S ribosome-binding factor RbfA [Nitrospirota bacterium]
MRQQRQKGYRRSVRVGDSLQQVIAEAIERTVDAPSLGLITVTHVDAAPDLRTARVYVSVLGGPLGTALEALAKASGPIQHEIATHLRLKWTPRLTFVGDTTPAQADHISQVLATLDPPGEEGAG